MTTGEKESAWAVQFLARAGMDATETAADELVLRVHLTSCAECERRSKRLIASLVPTPIVKPQNLPLAVQMQIARQHIVEVREPEQSGKGWTLSLLDAWGAILPIRIAKEDLGDYMEDIRRRADEGQPAWLLSLRVITALVWTGINTVGFVSKNLLGKDAESHPDKQVSK